MEKQLAHFTPLNPEMLLETNGGGFAYDVGRVIRFLLINGTGALPAVAISDWTVNSAENQAVNQ